MPTDLTLGLRAGGWPDGSVVGADGVLYRRRSTRLRRREADALVASGLPVVLDLWSRGQLDWYAGVDAAEVWDRVVTAEPTAKQLAKGVVWTAGVWKSVDCEQVAYMTGRWEELRPSTSHQSPASSSLVVVDPTRTRHYRNWIGANTSRCIA